MRTPKEIFADKSTQRVGGIRLGVNTLDVSYMLFTCFNTFSRNNMKKLVKQLLCVFLPNSVPYTTINDLNTN